jgi:serine/threonine protein phosphatase PrpC
METLSSPLQVATLLHAGRVRRFNEDAITADEKYCIAIVADGMGRNRAGEVASRMARDIVLARLRAANREPLREEELRPGNVFLVYSDGLNDMVDESDIELIVNSLHMNLQFAAKHSVQLANDHGGLENVSVVPVKGGTGMAVSSSKWPISIRVPPRSGRCTGKRFPHGVHRVVGVRFPERNNKVPPQYPSK